MACQNDKGVQELMRSYKATQALGIQLPFGRRGGPQLTQQAVQPDPRSGSLKPELGGPARSVLTTTLGSAPLALAAKCASDLLVNLCKLLGGRRLFFPQSPNHGN
eukprot:4690009-Amphidinium_carterae.1